MLWDTESSRRLTHSKPNCYKTCLFSRPSLIRLTRSATWLILSGKGLWIVGPTPPPFRCWTAGQPHYSLISKSITDTYSTRWDFCNFLTISLLNIHPSHSSNCILFLFFLLSIIEFQVQGIKKWTWTKNKSQLEIVGYTHYSTPA